VNEAILTARTRLWEWLSERDDPDPEQRAWKTAYAEGLVDACEATGLLPAGEVAQWRRLLAGELEPPAAEGDEAAAARHLERLLAAVPPMSREPNPEAFAAGRRFHGALAALHRSGILSDEEQRRWRSRGLAAEAPWLDEDDVEELTAATGIYAIAIPAASPEEEAADEAAAQELESIIRRGRAREVYVPDSVVRHDGLAITAVVTRSDATEVTFHHVGGPQGEGAAGRGRLDAFSAALDALVAPALSDDAGNRYEPVSPQPVDSHGTGGDLDPDRPRVITGTWRYQPSAPDGVQAFAVTAGGTRWELRSRR
jgi:hypothetical protein